MDDDLDEWSTRHMPQTLQVSDGLLLPVLGSPLKISLALSSNRCAGEVQETGRALAPGLRTPTDGMTVKSASERAKTARKMVFEMLLADQPARETS